jgi:translation initiation factor 4E
VKQDEPSEEQLTKLNYEFCFWYLYFKEQRMKQTDNYEDNIKKIGVFSSAEEFWGYYQHIRRPEYLPKCCEFFLFKSNIRPMWEDPANMGGGRFVIHIKRIFANKAWEDIIIAFIISTADHDHLNGIVMNVRSYEVLLSVWVKPLETEPVKDKYRSWIMKALGLTDPTKVEYKDHPTIEESKAKQAEFDPQGGSSPFQSGPRQPLTTGPRPTRPEAGEVGKPEHNRPSVQAQPAPVQSNATLGEIIALAPANKTSTPASAPVLPAN